MTLESKRPSISIFRKILLWIFVIGVWTLFYWYQGFKYSEKKSSPSPLPEQIEPIVKKKQPSKAWKTTIPLSVPQFGSLSAHCRFATCRTSRPKSTNCWRESWRRRTCDRTTWLKTIYICAGLISRSPGAYRRWTRPSSSWRTGAVPQSVKNLWTSC